MAATVLAAILAVVTPAAARGPGALDRSFGRDGTVVTGLSGQERPRFGCCFGKLTRPVVTLPDGALIVGGHTVTDENRAVFGLERYTPAGRLDRRWGDDGRVAVLPEGVFTARVEALVRAPGDGVIAVGTGWDADGSRRLAAVRLAGTGRPVWSVSHAIGARWHGAGDALLQLDGKVVVAGSATATDRDGPMLAAARLDGFTGALDPGFAGTGYVIDERADPCRLGGPAEAAALAQLSSGAIVLAGARYTCQASTSYPLLSVYNLAGERELARFGYPALGLNGIWGLVRAPDNTLYASGGGGRTRASVVHYGTDTRADLDFSDDGLALLSGEQNAGVGFSIVVQDDGRLLTAVGESGDRTSVHRLLPNGELDETFDTGGLAASAIRYPSELVLQPDGGVVVAGAVRADEGDPDPSVALSRLYGGSEIGRVAVARRAPRGGVRVRCAGAPGCEGVVRLGRFGRARYALDDGERATVRVRVRGRRVPRFVRVRVTNPPARSVRLRVRVR